MKKTCILMSTYNGSKFLGQQLASIRSQKVEDWRLVVRDDGSSDNTMEILTTQMGGNFDLLDSKDNLGPARSFFKLMMEAPLSDYYAFCDQDDVWDKDKLTSAIAYLEKGDNDIPALYFSQVQLVDEHLNPLPTAKINPKCTFYEGLIAHYATGCTFVFNRTLLELVRKYNPEYISMHDLWLYHLCLAVGGNVYFDPIPHIKYRQHSHNVIGLSGGWKKALRLRWQRTIKKDCERSNTITELYKGYKDKIKPEYLPVVTHIVNYRNSVKDLLWLLFYRRLRCDNWHVNITMRIALLLHTY